MACQAIFLRCIASSMSGPTAGLSHGPAGKHWSQTVTWEAGAEGARSSALVAGQRAE